MAKKWKKGGEYYKNQIKRYKHKIYKRTVANKQLNTYIGTLRLLHDVKKLNYITMINEDKDSFLDSWKAYTPAQRFD